MLRPSCETPRRNPITGTTTPCGQSAHNVGNDKHGNPRYRKYVDPTTGDLRYTCYGCHVRRNPHLTMSRNTRKGKAYKNHRKHYCENRDGHLGFVCRANIVDQCMLSVDHIDGRPWNNDPKNYKTLCLNCHCYKTKYFRDSNPKSIAVRYTNSSPRIDVQQPELVISDDRDSDTNTSPRTMSTNLSTP